MIFSLIDKIRTVFSTVLHYSMSLSCRLFTFMLFTLSFNNSIQLTYHYLLIYHGILHDYVFHSKSKKGRVLSSEVKYANA